MPYVLIDGYITEIPEAGTSTISVLDGSGDITAPIIITRYESSADSRNIEHTLIDGSMAITLIGDSLPSGTLSLLYTSDSTAKNARLMFARPASFALTDAERPVLDMVFVRSGRLGSVIHDEIEGVWTLDVGYREVIA